MLENMCQEEVSKKLKNLYDNIYYSNRQLSDEFNKHVKEFIQRDFTLKTPEYNINIHFHCDLGYCFYALLKIYDLSNNLILEIIPETSIGDFEFKIKFLKSKGKIFNHYKSVKISDHYNETFTSVNILEEYNLLKHINNVIMYLCANTNKNNNNMYKLIINASSNSQLEAKKLLDICIKYKLFEKIYNVDDESDEEKDKKNNKSINEEDSDAEEIECINVQYDIDKTERTNLEIVKNNESLGKVIIEPSIHTDKEIHESNIKIDLDNTKAKNINITTNDGKTKKIIDNIDKE